MFDLAGDGTWGHGWGESEADEVPPDRVFSDLDLFPLGGVHR